MHREECSPALLFPKRCQPERKLLMTQKKKSKHRISRYLFGGTVILDFTYSTDDMTVCISSRFTWSSNTKLNPGEMVSEVRRDTM